MTFYDLAANDELQIQYSTATIRPKICVKSAMSKPLVTIVCLTMPPWPQPWRCAVSSNLSKNCGRNGGRTYQYMHISNADCSHYSVEATTRCRRTLLTDVDGWLSAGHCRQNVSSNRFNETKPSFPLSTRQTDCSSVAQSQVNLFIAVISPADAVGQWTQAGWA